MKRVLPGLLALTWAVQPLLFGYDPTLAVVGLALGALAWQLWSVRRHLDPHADMILLMGGFGGLGMWLGPWLYYGGVTLPACHYGLGGWLAMNAGMFALGLPPALLWSRCVAIARRDGFLVPKLAADTIGMLGGMCAGHWLVPIALGSLTHHAGMVAGMLGGMALPALFFTPRVLPMAQLTPAGSRQ